MLIFTVEFHKYKLHAAILTPSHPTIGAYIQYPRMNACMDFPFVTEVPLRFRDLDTMGHVNNAVYVTLLEQARTDFVRDVLNLGLDEVDSVVASLSIDYLSPIQLSDTVTVGIAIGDLGRSSIPMRYEIHAGDRLAATAETTLVTFDSSTQSSAPIPPSWREAIEPYQVTE